MRARVEILFEEYLGVCKRTLIETIILEYEGQKRKNNTSTNSSMQSGFQAEWWEERHLICLFFLRERERERVMLNSLGLTHNHRQTDTQFLASWQGIPNVFPDLADQRCNKFTKRNVLV